MNFKKFISGVSALAIAATTFVGMAVTANAAGYTRTLTDQLKVAGYKTKAFYNFQNNTPEVLPTSGDMCYRSGNIWGLHNYKSGERSATATIPVAATDILVIQNYTGYTATINRGSENTTLSSTTGYQVFDITTAANDITFTVPRYGGIVAALVMEVDNTVATYDYTINYKNGNDTVKQTTGKVAEGSVISVESSFWANSVKYITETGQAASLTVSSTAANNTLDINVRTANTYTAKTINGETVFASASVTEGDDAYLPYPRFILSGTTLSEAEQGNGGYYRHKFTGVSANEDYTVTYTPIDGTCVYYKEAEALEGVETTTGNNADIRCSYGAGATKANNVAITSLPAGKYKIYTNVWGTSGGTYTISAGTRAVLKAQTNGNYTVQNSDEFVLDRSTALTLNITNGNANRVLDYIYIMKTGEAVEDGKTMKAFAFDGITADAVANQKLTIKVGDSKWTDPVALPTSTQFSGDGEVGIAFIISGIPEDVAVSARIID